MEAVALIFVESVVDIDECSTDRRLCQPGICKNTMGAFICDCDTGYSVKKGKTGCTGTSSVSAIRPRFHVLSFIFLSFKFYVFFAFCCLSSFFSCSSDII